jgi:hypothetical protein
VSPVRIAAPVGAIGFAGTFGGSTSLDPLSRIDE